MTAGQIDVIVVNLDSSGDGLVSMAELVDQVPLHIWLARISIDTLLFSLTSLECPVSELVTSDACPRPATQAVGCRLNCVREKLLSAVLAHAVAGAPTSGD